MDTGKLVGWILFSGILALVSSTDGDSVKVGGERGSTGAQSQSRGEGGAAQPTADGAAEPVRVGEGPSAL